MSQKHIILSENILNAIMPCILFESPNDVNDAMTLVNDKISEMCAAAITDTK